MWKAVVYVVREAKPGVDVTTLTNGLRVASTEASVPITSVGVYVEVGSRHETATNNGTTSLIEKMAFKVDFLQLFFSPPLFSTLSRRNPRRNFKLHGAYSASVHMV